MTLFVILCLTAACGAPRSRSSKSFDDLHKLIQGKSAAEIERILGKPDFREKLVLAGERWVWWNYTFLDGQKYPPNDRGRLVHLEIIFSSTGDSGALSNLRPIDPLSITYSFSKPAS